MDPYDAITTGLTELEDHDVEPVSHGAVKETYALSGPEDDYIVQVAVPGDGRVRLAGELYDRIHAETSIPTPEIVDRGWEHDAVPYLVMERSPGDNIEDAYDGLDPDRVDAIVDQAGGFLGEAHASVELEGYGYLDIKELTGEHDDWRSFMDEHVQEQCAALAGTVFDPGALMLRVSQQWDRYRDLVPEDVEPAIVHNDYRPGNMLVDDDTVTAVLDWDNAFAGDALYDYVMAEESFMAQDEWSEERNEEVREAFRSAYEQHRSVEDGVIQDVYRMTARLSEARAFQWWRDGGHDLPDELIHRSVDGLEKAVLGLETQD